MSTTSLLRRLISPVEGDSRSICENDDVSKIDKEKCLCTETIELTYLLESRLISKTTSWQLGSLKSCMASSLREGGVKTHNTIVLLLGAPILLFLSSC